MTMPTELVSIILPTRNSIRTLKDCLESIITQTYPNIEIIIIDNYSVDSTRDLASSYSARVILGGPKPPNNNFFTAPNLREEGATYASGKYIFFIDSDMIIERELISECVDKCNKGADAILVSEISFGQGFWAKCRIVERASYLGDDNIQAARFFKKSVYDLIGGWKKEAGSFDDWEITLRLRKKGYSLNRTKNLIHHNDGKIELINLFRKKYRMGKTTDFKILQNLDRGFEDVIFTQITPLRILNIVQNASRKRISINIIIGIIILKTIEGLGFFLGNLMEKLFIRKM